MTSFSAVPSMLRRLAAAFAATLVFGLPASATTYSVDFTDLWYNPGESGWGVNLIQQNEVIFATLFAYGPDNTNRWFVAPALMPAGSNTFSGTLYQTSGPYFGAGGFDPNAVTNTQVGTMTVSFGSSTTGTLNYSVSGVGVTKSIQRQTWRINNLSGNYLGGMIGRGSNCSVLAFDTLTITHNGGSVSMVVDFRTASNQAARCTYSSNTYGQAGKLGSMSGTFNCTINGAPGNSGSFSMSNIQADLTGFSAHFSGGDQFCSSYNGFFGGVRDVF